jgi:ATP-dependent DNA helicase RecQ
LIAKVAEVRPSDIATMTRILGDRRAERFGPAFLEVIDEAAR